MKSVIVGIVKINGYLANKKAPPLKKSMFDEYY